MKTYPPSLLDRITALLMRLSTFHRMLIFSLTGLSAMLVVGIPPLFEINRLVQESRVFDEKHLAGAVAAADIRAAHLNARLTMLAIVAEADPERRIALEQNLEAHDANFIAGVARLRNLVPEDSESLLEIEPGHRSRVVFRTRMIQLANAGRGTEALTIANDQKTMDAFQRQLSQPLDQVMLAITRHVSSAANESFARHAAVEQLGLATMLFGTLIFILLTVITSRSVAAPLGRLRNEIVALTEGRRENDIPFADQHNEIGDIARALISLQKLSIELENQRWVKAQTAEILESTQQANSLQDFGQRTLTSLCPAVGAVQGLMYVDRDSNNIQHPVSGYGRTPDGPTYAIGESLVGQCMRDRRPLVIEDPTESLLRLSSGLVDAAPRQVRLLPLVQRKAATGIIELAFITVPDGCRQMLLDTLPDALAPALEVLRRNLRTESLAEEIQEQAEELEMQKEELLRSGASLLQANTLMNQVMAAASEIAIISTDQAGLTTLFNSGAENLFGWRAEEVVGCENFICFHLAEELDAAAHGQDRDATGFANIIAGTEVEGRESREWTFVRKDGSQFAGLLLTTPTCAANGTTTGYLCIVQDITLRQTMEREMKRARELAEEASRMKSDFLANMSHEIRTPMNGIIGMTHLVLNTEMTLRQRDYVKKIQLSGQHLLRIINDILDISKIEAGKLTIEHTDFELEAALASVVNLIAEKAADKGLELILDVASDVPVDVVGDSLRLGQVLINYANNALKFTERGEITVMVRVREVSEDSVLLWFAVRDTGIGLTEEQRSRLFTAFTQGDTSTTRIYGGTGLGLAISKQLAEMMGGEAGVDSVPDVGSTFWFTTRLGINHKVKRVLLPEPDLRGRHVLVVDDNDNARLVMNEMLTSMSFAVDVVASGRDAIAAVERADRENQPYELVFMDWHMPAMNGIDACRQIQSLPLTEPPHMLLVTAYGREEVFHQAEDAGIHDVLVKPLNSSATGCFFASSGSPTTRRPVRSRSRACRFWVYQLKAPPPSTFCA